MENKPFFIDEKEMAALKGETKQEEPKKEVKEEVVETKTVEETPVLEEEKEKIVTEEKKEEKQELVKTEPVKDIEKVENKKGEKAGFQMDLKMFTTIFLAIIVTYCFLTVARSLYMGFKYYDYAHGDKTAEVQK